MRIASLERPRRQDVHAGSVIRLSSARGRSRPPPRRRPRRRARRPRAPRAAASSPSSRANGSIPTSPSSTASSPGSATTRGARRSMRAGASSCPGFIDAHMHLESTKLLPDEFARLVLPLGTTAVVADPHEIANVLGTDGVHWLLDFCDELPLDIYFMASSCVPASAFESPRRAAERRRPRGPAAPPARARARGDDELPRRHRGRRERALEAAAARARGTSTAMRPASPARS